MAQGPDGVRRAAPLQREAEGFNRLEHELAEGLERVIDGTLGARRWSEPFVYGIHQALSPRMADALRRRYAEAGWSEVIVRAGETGAHTLVLHP